MKSIKIMSLLAVLGAAGVSQVHAAVSVPVVAHQVLMQKFMATPVPEPSDWAVIPVVLTIAVIAWRRFGRKASA